jgi:hypothetical protein
MICYYLTKVAFCLAGSDLAEVPLNIAAFALLHLTAPQCISAPLVKLDVDNV